MYRLGLDFYDTISTHKKGLKKLAQFVLDSGGEVHIISAINPENDKRLLKDVKGTYIKYTRLHIVHFTHYNDVPMLKRKLAKQLRLDMFIDDRQDTCSEMLNYNITAFQALNK
jgi:hypothetical protein